MTGNQQSALSMLRSAHPVYSRLEGSRHPEDLAADIIELWSATETALRALMGGSPLAGQALIRELRQRELISLGQAHALLAFLDARERSGHTSYHPTQQDIASARDGFQQLETGLTAGTTGSTANAQPGYSNAAPPTNGYVAPAAAGDSAMAATVPARSLSTRTWALIALGLLLVAGVAGYAMMTRDGGQKALETGIDNMQAGRREAARTEFAKAARENPNAAAPHVFLARLAREDGDLLTARRELETAIRLEPTNTAALREMGLFLFNAGDYELARRFFVRAVQSNPDDPGSQGYLGCTLMRLNRAEEGRRFISRAGSGTWSACAQPAAALPPPIP